MKITWGCCRQAVHIEPPWWVHLPDDVLRTIASFLDASAWRRETELIHVLNLLQVSPDVFVQKLTEHRDWHIPYELVYIGYMSLGHGYGEIRSVVFLKDDTFKVGSRKGRARRGDVVSRDLVDESVLQNSTLIQHSANVPVYIRRGNVNVIVTDVTPRH